MKKLRNIAIVAHVDHGKTTLVDRLLQQTVLGERDRLEERALDTNELERERGITILSKVTAVEYKGHRINIVDTPGHADFGGEVERVLSMVDAVLLLVDAVEGPMPQTRFVTRKAFDADLQPILVVNKIDRQNARPYDVQEEVFELFDQLGATNDQLDFKTVFASATHGTSGLDLEHLDQSMNPLLDVLLENVPIPRTSAGPFQMQVSTLDYSPYVGVIGIGRIHRGVVHARDEVIAIDREGEHRKGRILAIQANRGLERTELERGEAGDIVCITGIDGIEVSDTLCDPAQPERLPALVVDEPTVTMSFCVNSSPFVGKAGRFRTSRHLRERLLTEASHNVALRVATTQAPDKFDVSGRGELHLSILIETMRREGFELEVSKPSVILKEVEGRLQEPFELVVFDIEQGHEGAIIEALGDRRGELVDMVPDAGGRLRISFVVATRLLLGFRSEFATLTSGTGIMTFSTAGYRDAIAGAELSRRNGALVSNASGLAVAYALFNLQERGKLFISPGTEIYPGMIVGINSRREDLVVNPMKTKKLTNIRAAANDENVLLTPPLPLTLESALELIKDDELVEVTPDAIRMRKKSTANKRMSKELRRSALGAN